MPKYLHGMHDRGGEHLMTSAPGWVLVTEAIGHNPIDDNGKSYADIAPHTPIVRLNNGYGSAGTIPLPESYVEFAERCARFVAASSGCSRWIIGNEPNHENEWADGEPITPESYADCFNLCYTAIKRVAPTAEIVLAPVAPYTKNVESCITYFQNLIEHCEKFDGIALHAYTHGSDPSLITSEAMMDPPLQNCHYHFRVYQDFLRVIPATVADLPIYITESNQTDPWLDLANGWIPSALAEIDRWNASQSSRRIQCLIMYRWEDHDDDQWEISTKGGTQADFFNGVKRHYLSPDNTSNLPPSPGPGVQPPGPGQGPGAPPPLPLVWDQRLNERGASLTQPAVGVGHGAYRVVVGKWFDEAESAGRHNLYVRLEDDAGQLIPNVPIKQFWQTGSTAPLSEVKDDDWLESMGLPSSYSRDFEMSNVAPSYGVTIDNLIPSDVVKGLGLGDLENPNMKIHTSAYFCFRLTGQGVDPGPNPLPPILTDLVHPAARSRISQHFYLDPAAYEPFGLPGHGGTDFAYALGSPVMAMTAGVVAWVDTDPGGYGNYVRIFHPQYKIHSFYAHLQAAQATAGQLVQAGDVIGSCGSTGNSTGPHLHFEIRLATSDGGYASIAPMPNGRIDPETWAAIHGLRL